MGGPAKDIRIDGRRRVGPEAQERCRLRAVQDSDRALEEGRAAGVIDEAELRCADQSGEKHVEEHVNNRGLFD